MEKQYTFPYRQYTLPDGATPEERLLIEEARKAAQGAYAPFSGYRVGAAARLASGRIITAANQESEVFPAASAPNGCCFSATWPPTRKTG